MRFRFKKPDNPLVSKLPARLVSITVLMLLAMVLVLLWTREAGNNTAKIAGEARLAAALDNELHLLVLDAVDQASNPEFARNAARQALRGITDDLPLTIFDLTATGASARMASPLAQTLQTSLATDFARARVALSASLRASIDENSEDRNVSLLPRLSASGISLADGELFAWAMVPASQRNAEGGTSPVAFVKYKPINAAFEVRVAVAARTGFVSLASSPQRARDSEQFAYTRGGEPVFVSWLPDRPGDRHST